MVYIVNNDKKNVRKVTAITFLTILALFPKNKGGSNIFYCIPAIFVFRPEAENDIENLAFGVILPYITHGLFLFLHPFPKHFPTKMEIEDFMINPIHENIPWIHDPEEIRLIDLCHQKRSFRYVIIIYRICPDIFFQYKQ